MHRRTLLAAVGVGLAGCGDLDAERRVAPEERDAFDAPEPPASATERSGEVVLGAGDFAVPERRERAVEDVRATLDDGLDCAFLSGEPTCGTAAETASAATVSPADDRRVVSGTRDAIRFAVENPTDEELVFDTDGWRLHRHRDGEWHSLGSFTGDRSPFVVPPDDGRQLVLWWMAVAGFEGITRDDEFRGVAVGGLSPGIYAHVAPRRNGPGSLVVVHGVAGSATGPIPRNRRVAVEGETVHTPPAAGDDGRWGRLRVRRIDAEPSRALLPEHVAIDPLLREAVPIAAGDRYPEATAWGIPTRAEETTTRLAETVGDPPVDVTYLGRAMRLAVDRLVEESEGDDR